VANASPYGAAQNTHRGIDTEKYILKQNGMELCPLVIVTETGNQAAYTTIIGGSAIISGLERSVYSGNEDYL
jgi:hypothetical protein